MEAALEIFNTYRALAQHLASLVLLAAAWRWGGAPERWLASSFVLIMVAPVYVLRALVAEVNHPVLGAWLMLDLAAGGVFILIALYANRNYPLWVAGFQLVALGAHLVGQVDLAITQLAMAILVIGPSYGQLLVLIAGFVRHLRRERRFGPYRDWRTARPVIGGLPT
jgi:hypothetical protein